MGETMTSQDDIFTISEVASLLKVTKKTVYNDGSNTLTDRCFLTVGFTMNDAIRREAKQKGIDLLCHFTPSKLESLKQEFPNLANDVSVWQRDASKVIQGLCISMDWHSCTTRSNP